jgi:hypothetical protein
MAMKLLEQAFEVRVQVYRFSVCRVLVGEKQRPEYPQCAQETATLVLGYLLRKLAHLNDQGRAKVVLG